MRLHEIKIYRDAFRRQFRVTRSHEVADRLARLEVEVLVRSNVDVRHVFNTIFAK